MVKSYLFHLGNPLFSPKLWLYFTICPMFIGKIFKLFIGGNPLGIRVTIKTDGGLYIVKRFSFVLTLLLFYVLVTFTVYADTSPKYSVREWRISAVINPDGSIDVEEHITYDLSRTHEGPVVRYVDIAHSSRMEKLEVFAVIPAATKGSDQSESQYDLKPYEFVDDPDQNMSEVYTTRPGARPEEIQDVCIYLPTGDGQHTVVLRYRLNDLVYLYRDVAVLYWNPILNGYGLDVRNVDMRIALPQGTKPDNVKAFVYGALEGSCEVLEDGTAVIMAKKLDSEEFIEVTVAFPKEGVSRGRKVIDNDGLERVLEEQRLKAEEMELLRRQEEREQKLRLAAIVGMTVGIIGIGVCVGIWVSSGRLKLSSIFSEIKRRVPDTPAGQAITAQGIGASEEPKDETQREMPAVDLPADYYTPAELSALLHGKRIRPGDMVATLLDLAVRRYLDVKVSGGKAYVLTLRDFDHTNLKPHEEYLVNWFFKDIGDGKKVSTKAILQTACTRGFEREFCNRFAIWKELVLRQAIRWGFNKRVTPFKIYIRTPFGKQHYRSWMGFKKTLKQLSHKAHSLPPADWERFFAYAFSMGIGRQVIDGLKKAYSEGGTLKGDLAILGKGNFGAIDHWLDLAKRFNLMSSRLLRIFVRPAALQLLVAERNHKKSM